MTNIKQTPNNIISFYASTQVVTSPFVAIHRLPQHDDLASSDDIQVALSISPRIMSWSKDMILIDLRTTWSYWCQLACEKKLSIDDLFSQLCPGHTCMVLADHPWSALLHSQTLAMRGCTGFLNLNAPMGKSLTQDLSWDVWNSACHQFLQHLSSLHHGKKQNNRVQSLRKGLLQLRRTVDGIQASTPAHLKHQPAASIARRFGAELARIWDWTWQQQNPSSLTDPFADFPWNTYKQPRNPEVHLLLDHPIRNWDHIEPHLCVDFDRLCRLPCWSSSERVVSLEWELIFVHRPSLKIPVLFRHPHALHRESGHHKTALLQAFYSWENTLQKQLKGSLLEDDGIMEWNLRIHERITPIPQLKSLFADDFHTPLAKLRDLENSLPIPLHSYFDRNDWTPTKSCAPSPLKVDENLNIQLHAQHRDRPLFLDFSTDPLAFKKPARILPQKSERTMRHWWESSDLKLAVADFQYVLTGSHEFFWIEQNALGRFISGVWG
jgi:hypothetical protein